MHARTLAPTLAQLDGYGLVYVTLWGEARGEPVEGQIAVAHVIRNRLHSGKWFGGVNYHDVLERWAQFSCLWPQLGGLNYQGVLDQAGVYQREETLPGAQGRLQAQLQWVVGGVLDSLIMDNTSGSTHYYSKYIEAPAWTRPPAVRMTELGRHVFFTGVS